MNRSNSTTKQILFSAILFSMALFVTDAVSQEKRIKFGQLAGTVRDIKGKDVIIAGQNISQNVVLGELLVIDTGSDDELILRADFPMMTHIRCGLISGNIGKIKNGMNVHKRTALNKEGKLGIEAPVGILRVDKEHPYKILSINSKGAAYKAGLLPEDEIVSIDNIQLMNLNYTYIFENLVKGKAGTRVTFVIKRNGQQKTISVVRQ